MRRGALCRSTSTGDSTQRRMLGGNTRFAKRFADGWPIDEFDNDLAETPLRKAARIGHLEIARMLLAAGADVNRHCEERIGETPLGLVADTCEPDLARLLMDAGADPTIRGWMGITALDRAADRTDEAGKEVLALLHAYQPKRRGP